MGGLGSLLLVECLAVRRIVDGISFACESIFRFAQSRDAGFFLRCGISRNLQIFQLIQGHSIGYSGDKLFQDRIPAVVQDRLSFCIQDINTGYRVGQVRIGIGRIVGRQLCADLRLRAGLIVAIIASPLCHESGFHTWVARIETSLQVIRTV